MDTALNSKQDSELLSVPTEEPEYEGGRLLYRFEGRLTEMHKVGVFPEGLRMVNVFDGTVTDGPLKDARVWGIDHFLIRPDGVGELDAPETFSRDGLHIVGNVRGFALPPDGVVIPPLETLMDPAFEWPDIPFALRGSVQFRAEAAEFDWMNRTIAIISGEVLMSTGRLSVEARAVE